MVMLRVLFTLSLALCILGKGCLAETSLTCHGDTIMSNMTAPLLRYCTLQFPKDFFHHSNPSNLEPYDSPHLLDRLENTA